MLLYCLNCYNYLLWRHWEYEDEWDIVASIKELCVVVLNAIIVVTIFSHSKIGTYGLRVKRYLKLKESSTGYNRRKHNSLRVLGRENFCLRWDSLKRLP